MELILSEWVLWMSVVLVFVASNGRCAVPETESNVRIASYQFFWVGLMSGAVIYSSLLIL